MRGGIMSQKIGANSEVRFETICKYLLNIKIAEIYKNPTQMRMNQMGKYFYAKKSTVDFTGYRIKDARYIAIELKKRASKSAFTDDRIHQWNYLSRVMKSGGIAFYIIEVNNIYYVFKPFENEIEKAPKINFTEAIVVDADYVNKLANLIRES